MDIKLALACHIRLFAEGIKNLLENDPEIEVIGIGGCIGELEGLLHLKPAVVLADHELGEELFHTFGTSCDFKILMINNSAQFLASHRDLQAMVARGFAGILSCEADTDILKKAIKAVHAGDLWVDCETLKHSLHLEPDQRATLNLTNRETEVIRHLCQGFSNKQIAQQLFITEQTVKAHINHLFKKFGVSNRLELALCTHKLISEHPFGD